VGNLFDPRQKESGGLAGTFTPNAAYVATVLQLQIGVPYTLWVIWRANRAAQVANAIYAGTGPDQHAFLADITDGAAVPLTPASSR
jgi:hypothetical protein